MAIYTSNERLYITDKLNSGHMHAKDRGVLLQIMYTASDKIMKFDFLRKLLQQC